MYEQPRFGQHLGPPNGHHPTPPIITVGGQEYGSLNGALVPSSGGNNNWSDRDVKAKRRESSVLMMVDQSLNQRAQSGNRMEQSGRLFIRIR